MTREEAEKYADNMTYRDAIYNLMQARAIWVRFKDIEKIVDKYLGQSEDEK